MQKRPMIYPSPLGERKMPHRLSGQYIVGQERRT
jgi:hypothetical protein